MIGQTIRELVMKERRRAPSPPGAVRAEPVTQEEPSAKAVKMPAAERAFREQVWLACGHTEKMPAKELDREISVKPIYMLSEFEGGRRRVGVTVSLAGLRQQGVFRVFVRGGLANAMVYPAQRVDVDRRVTWSLGPQEQVSPALRQALLAFLDERGMA